MVLQQAPARAAVSGHLASTSGEVDPAVSVTVDDGQGATYTVDAVVSPDGTTWKALLTPAVAGGVYTIAAQCTSGCTGAATLTDVTFGDVWLCSGQSNSAQRESNPRSVHTRSVDRVPLRWQWRCHFSTRIRATSHATRSLEASTTTSGSPASRAT